MDGKVELYIQTVDGENDHYYVRESKAAAIIQQIDNGDKTITILLPNEKTFVYLVHNIVRIFYLPVKKGL